MPLAQKDDAGYPDEEKCDTEDNDVEVKGPQPEVPYIRPGPSLAVGDQGAQYLLYSGIIHVETRGREGIVVSTIHLLLFFFLSCNNELRCQQLDYFMRASPTRISILTFMAKIVNSTE